MASQLEMLRRALQGDPQAQYGELLPLARGGENDWQPQPQGPGAPPWQARPEPGQLRFAMPQFLRDSLLGATDLMEGAAGERPAGGSLPPRASLAMMDIPGATMGVGAASRAMRGGGAAFDPNMLGANWGGKNHSKRLKQLYHGSRSLIGAEGLRKSRRFSEGRSAELGIEGTSLSYDPGVSAGEFGGDTPNTFFLNWHDVDPSEVYNLRPSDYLAKDFSGAIPSRKDPTAPKPSTGKAPASGTHGTSAEIGLKLKAKQLEDKSPHEAAKFVSDELGVPVNFDFGIYSFFGPDGKYNAEDILDVFKIIGEDGLGSKGAAKGAPAPASAAQVGDDLPDANQVADELQSMDDQFALIDSDQVDGMLSNENMVVVQNGPSFDVVDLGDGETLGSGSSIADAVSDVAGKELIDGQKLQEIKEYVGAAAPTSSVDPGGPEGGAALIRKPQSYYQEGEYFAPTETGGQGRFTPLAASEATNIKPSGRRQQQRGLNYSRKYMGADTTLSGLHESASPQELLAKLRPMSEVEGGAARRELALSAAKKLDRMGRRSSGGMLGAMVGETRPAEEMLVSRAFFPRQQQQAERLQGLARDIVEAKNLQDNIKPEAARGARRGPERQEFDDAVRQETRAIDRFYKALGESDLPEMDNRKRWDKISGDVQRIGKMMRGQHSLLMDLGETGKIVANNMPELVQHAGNEGVPLAWFSRTLQDDLQQKGPITRALAKGDTDEAVQALERLRGKSEFDSDNPEDIMR